MTRKGRGKGRNDTKDYCKRKIKVDTYCPDCRRHYVGEGGRVFCAPCRKAHTFLNIADDNNIYNVC
jgi:hypothetical protein